jgi:hypothetical protein
MYEGYPEINFHSHVEHEVVGAACRGCTAVLDSVCIEQWQSEGRAAVTRLATGVQNVCCN